MHFERESERAAIQWIKHQIERLEVGECLTVSRSVLQEIGSAELVPGYTWTPAERIMESVLGSAWTVRFWTNHQDGSVTFQKVEEQEVPTYTSPDRNWR